MRVQIRNTGLLYSYFKLPTFFKIYLFSSCDESLVVKVELPLQSHDEEDSSLYEATLDGSGEKDELPDEDEKLSDR
jgi:hypothetical protein